MTDRHHRPHLGIVLVIATAVEQGAKFKAAVEKFLATVRAA